MLIFSQNFANWQKLRQGPKGLFRETLKVGLLVTWGGFALPHHIVVLANRHSHVKAHLLALLAHMSIINSILDLLLVAKMRHLFKLLLLEKV